MRIRVQCIIERLTWSVFGRGWTLFLPEGTNPYTWPSVSSLDSVSPRRRRAVAYSWITPRQTTRRTHSWETRLENSTSSCENKTGKIKRNSFFLIFKFDRLRLRLRSSSSSLVVWSLVAVLLLVSGILFLLARSVSISGRPSRRGPARQLNARGIAKLPRGWSFAHHHDHHYRSHYHILLEILCLTSPSSHTHAYALVDVVTLCTIDRSDTSDKW